MIIGFVTFARGAVGIGVVPAACAIRPIQRVHLCFSSGKVIGAESTLMLVCAKPRDK